MNRRVGVCLTNDNFELRKSVLSGFLIRTYNLQGADSLSVETHILGKAL